MGWTWFRRWAPALLWFLVVSGLSTEAFSAEETGALLLPLLQWLFPGLSVAGLEGLHFALRKAGHVGEFAVLALLLYRALAWGRTGWQGREAVLSVLLTVGFAAADEWHQTFVPARTASVVDVGWDTLGALLALGSLWLLLWVRPRRDPGLGDARGGP